MTDPSVRPEIIVLLDGVYPHERDPRTWTRDDQPLTRDELELAMTISEDELRAAFEHLNEVDRGRIATRQLDIARLEDEDEVWARIEELTTPYFEQMPPGTTLEQIYPMLTPAESMELAVLLDASPEEAGGVIPNGDTEVIDVARHVAASFAPVTATRLVTEFAEQYAQVENLTLDTRPPLTAEFTNIIDNQGRKVTVHLDEVVSEHAKALNAVMTALAEGATEHALALQAAFYGVGEDDEAGDQ